jgi:hypothetical protein
MASHSQSSFPFWLVLILIGFGLSYTGLFYQTGAQYYDVCWRKAHANGREPESPEQAARWSKCESTANAALFGAGFVFSGNPQYATTPQLKALIAACPSNYRDIPITGAWFLAVQLIEDSGGPKLEDKFGPASEPIVRVFQTKWPSCVTVAEQNGFPKIVRQPDGAWAFQSPCIPCKPEQEAIAQSNREMQEWNSLPEEEKPKKAMESLLRENTAPTAK